MSSLRVSPSLRFSVIISLPLLCSQRPMLLPLLGQHFSWLSPSCPKEKADRQLKFSSLKNILALELAALLIKFAVFTMPEHF